MIRGIVLSGGASSRMGRDKGLIPIKNINWSLLAYQKLKALNILAELSINASQINDYLPYFESRDLIIDSCGAKGPLQGILSAHLKYPQDDLMILACDMIEMKIETLKSLKSIKTKHLGYDCYLYSEADQMEPLCAIYCCTFLKELSEKLDAGKLVNFSLYKIIQNSRYISLPIQDKPDFKNYNTPT